MAFNMVAALSANSSDTLEAIEKELQGAASSASNPISICCRREPAARRCAKPRRNCERSARARNGIFKIRQKELDAADYGQTILEETRKLNVGLGISVQQLVDGVRKETDAATGQARQEISLGDRSPCWRSAPRP